MEQVDLLKCQNTAWGGDIQRGTLLPAECNVPPDNGRGGDMQIPQAIRSVVLEDLQRADTSGGTGASRAASGNPKLIYVIYYTPGSDGHGPRFLTGGPGAAPGGVASKNG